MPRDKGHHCRAERAGLGGKNWLGAVGGMGVQRAGGGPFSLIALDRRTVRFAFAISNLNSFNLMKTFYFSINGKRLKI